MRDHLRFDTCEISQDVQSKGQPHFAAPQEPAKGKTDMSLAMPHQSAMDGAVRHLVSNYNPRSLSDLSLSRNYLKGIPI